MNKNPVVVTLIGAAMLLAGLVLALTGGPPAADPALIAGCEDRLAGQGDEMLARCQEQAFAAAMTATDAQEAATAISSANNDEVGGRMLSMFLIGLGLALTLGGLVGVAKQRNAVARP